MSTKGSLLRCHFRFLLMAIALFALPVLSFAQSTTTSNPNLPSTSPVNPTMAGTYLDNDRESLYAKFNDYKRNPNPEEQRNAYPTAKEFLRLWGGENRPEVKEVRAWVIEYERQMHQKALFAAYDAKDYAKTFTLARPMVKTDPEYFFGLAIMTEAGYDNSMAGNKNLDTETAEYARQAIALLEAGKVTRADPFKNMNIARSFLNFALATIVKDEAPAEAATAYAKALKTPDNPYSKDPIAYHRLGIALYKGQLAPLSNEYNEKFGGKQSSAEQTAMMYKLVKLSDQAVDAYARAVALMDKPEQKNARAQALAQLTALYKAFHNNSDEGLNELIAGVLAKPMP
ncbi:MAG TPA: hypothetical protein VHP99_00685 [Pyrinomonadaceae bacterium]|nr:hypothetical protein [Pyrinomonadaceae bacterium]